MTSQQYQDAIDWLFKQLPNYQNSGKTAYKPGLDNIRRLCDYFGNPQEKLKMIHVAGTNGKGSTCNMLASVLEQQGYKTGLFTSPHLIDFSERIRVNGQPCAQQFVFDMIEKLKNLPSDIQPSFFEFTTVMAFTYFAEQKLDFAVIETGLGGRLDATNIITPVVTAITNIGLDHQDLLGETLEEIAVEKAGIIKPAVPVISGEERPNIQEIFRSYAEAVEAPFINATTLEVPYTSDLTGNYQKKNIRVVIALIAVLKEQGIMIEEQAITEGLLHVHQNTGFIGRWFMFSEDPLVICDTAHNTAGLQLVFQQLSEMPYFKHIILGFVSDKKVEDMIPFLPADSRCYFVKPQNYRGLSPELYEDTLKKFKINYKIFQNLQQAYLFVKENITKEEMIFVGGSNFIVGEFLQNNLEL